MADVNASNLIVTLAANVDNLNLTDADFRNMVRNSIPLVPEVRDYWKRIAEEKRNGQR